SSGFTYLGQFIDHDLTFDPVSQLDRINDPDALRDFRTPRFDLDNIYGSGPNDQVFLYNEQDRKHLLFDDPNSDLQRNVEGTAIIGDPRNDENSIVANLQLAFIKYHNSVVDELQPTDDFDTASRIVRFHYQWLVVHDFLTKLVGKALVDEILVPVKDPGTGTVIQWNGNLRFFTPRKRPFMPVEFSVAAYRFGHSMVRFNYNINRLSDPGDTPGSKEFPIFDTENTPVRDLRGGRPLDAEHRVAWFRFFDFPEITDPFLQGKLQPARAIDTQISHGLGGLPTTVGAAPTGPPSLAERNLKRGKALGLPTGQDVARAMGIPEQLIISSSNPEFPFSIGTGYKLLDGTDDGSVPVVADDVRTRLTTVFADHTPLWYYILKEAELIQKGQILGPVGGRIVAEVFIGLLLADSQSYLVAQPGFQPKAGRFGALQDGQFGIVDLIRRTVKDPTTNN
ncbi:MAG: peroxidase family protein, partial [Pseudonocardiaceae bacterium]